MVHLFGAASEAVGSQAGFGCDRTAPFGCGGEGSDELGGPIHAPLPVRATRSSMVVELRGLPGIGTAGRPDLKGCW